MPWLSREIVPKRYRQAADIGGIPEQVSPADYDVVVDHVIERLRRSCGDVSIYDFGHVSCAGISDIDLLFVVPERIGPAQCRELIEACRGQRHFYHGPLIATPMLARSLGWLLPGVELRHLHGPRHLDELERPAPQALQEILLSVIFEAAIDRWFWFQGLEAESTLDLRKAILGLWALRRSILQKEILDIGLTAGEQTFCDSVRAIRDIWSQTARFDSEGAVRLLRRAPAVAEALIREVSTIAAEIGGRGCTTLTMNRGRVTLRRCDDRPMEARRYKLQFGRRRRAYHSIDLPAEAFDFLWKLRQADPALWGMPPSIVRRQRLVNDYHDFLAKRRLSGAAVPPGILVNQSPSRTMRSVDRAVSRLILRAERNEPDAMR